MSAILLLTLSFMTMYQGPDWEIGVIKDADGYTNLRSGPTIDAEVLRQIPSDDLVYYKRNGNSWWEVRFQWIGEKVGYVHSSRIVPLENYSVEEIEKFYGQEFYKEKKKLKLGNLSITMLNADRIGSDPDKVPEFISSYLEIQVPGQKPIKKYYPAIHPLGGYAGIAYVPVSSEPDFRFFVKDGDYDGRTIIIAEDGRVADIGGGQFTLFKRFVVSEVWTDGILGPIVWDLNLWESTYYLRHDPEITLKYEYGDHNFNYYISSGEFFLEIAFENHDPFILHMNENGKFVRVPDIPEIKGRIKLLPHRD